MRVATSSSTRQFGNQVLISSHRKLLRSKAIVVNVAEKSGHSQNSVSERNMKYLAKAAAVATAALVMTANLSTAKMSYIVAAHICNNRAHKWAPKSGTYHQAHREHIWKNCMLDHGQ